MPWSETCAMDERMRFIVAASEDDAVMSELCAEFGISRQTGYKVLARYRDGGVEGLKDRSRAPLSHGRAREAAVVEAVLALRERHPTWGPKKLRKKLGERLPGVEPPARSTIGDWLRKEGLTSPRRPPPPGPPVHPALPRRRRSQCGLGRRLQRLVFDRRSPALRSVDDQRRDEPIPAALPGSRPAGRAARASGFRGGVLRIWPAVGRSAPTMARRSPRSARADCRGFRCGGSSSASSRSGSNRASRSRTAVMSACIAP